jgi:hypothetical protein
MLQLKYSLIFPAVRNAWFFAMRNRTATSLALIPLSIKRTRPDAFCITMQIGNVRADAKLRRIRSRGSALRFKRRRTNPGRR